MKWTEIHVQMILDINENHFALLLDNGRSERVARDRIMNAESYRVRDRNVSVWIWDYMTWEKLE